MQTKARSFITKWKINVCLDRGNGKLAAFLALSSPFMLRHDRATTRFPLRHDERPLRFCPDTIEPQPRSRPNTTEQPLRSRPDTTELPLRSCPKTTTQPLRSSSDTTEEPLYSSSDTTEEPPRSSTCDKLGVKQQDKLNCGIKETVLHEIAYIYCVPAGHCSHDRQRCT